jgi:hypothetical protein
LLVICASALLLDRARTTVLRLNGALLIALIVSYVISRVIGVPVIGEGTEPVEAVGVVTQFAQAAGLFCIVAALRFEFGAVPYTQLSSSRKDSL